MAEQQRFWSTWNAQHREQTVGPVSEQQATVILDWMREVPGASLGKKLNILEVGCGSGWLCERLASFGCVTGTDLATEVLQRAQKRAQHIRFLAGDFLLMDFPEESFDVTVGLEVLSHVSDQASFLCRISKVLRGGSILCSRRRIDSRLSGRLELLQGHQGKFVSG